MKLKNLILEESRKKFSRLLCVTALSTCSLFAYAQQQPVRLTGSNIPLKSVFKQIEKQTKLFIDYNHRTLMTRVLSGKCPKRVRFRKCW